MKSLDVANYLIDQYGGSVEMTNLKLNKLVYLAQAVSLRQYGTPLFDDVIQAWDYGPVEPLVYRTFQSYGSGVISRPSGKFQSSDQLSQIAAVVMEKFGSLTAFDLVRLTHRDGAAWKMVHVPKANNVITSEHILSSDDGKTENVQTGTLAEGIRQVNQSWPNAMRMLEDS
ncbi:Panacea domain-containing protein [Bifidobacterium tissieri]|nr:type II toxin-antitoxin system antitoxin SocA domain-containing protein [Bifidobacterium tissieri]